MSSLTDVQKDQPGLALWQYQYRAKEKHGALY